jgi:hypothetical protein
MEIGLAVGSAVLGVLFGLVLGPIFGRSIERAVVRVLTPFGLPLVRRERDLTGIWRSTYTYTTRDSPGDWKGHHYVTLRHFQDFVVLRSLPHPEGSILSMELEVDDLVLTGTWREETGRDFEFYGALQLMLEPAGRRMNGLWVGFARSARIKSNEWTLERMTRTNRRRDRRHFTERARREFTLERSPDTGERILGYPDPREPEG